MQLELTARPSSGRLSLPQASRLWGPVLGMAVGILLWQLLALTGGSLQRAMPTPAAVLGRLVLDAGDRWFWFGFAQTVGRAAAGFAIALGLGLAVGITLVCVPIARSAIRPILASAQSMPSIAWFPLALLLFGLNEAAILVVVVLAAAPSIANGLLAGVDQVPPLLVQSGISVGARGIALYRHIVLPAALPGFVAGLRQAWAFGWRALMSGEILIQIGAHPSLGVRLQNAKQFHDIEGLVATMVVILLVGLAVDGIFTAIDRSVRGHRGLIEGR